jgi:hypothetical protein
VAQLPGVEDGNVKSEGDSAEEKKEEPMVLSEAVEVCEPEGDLTAALETLQHGPFRNGDDTDSPTMISKTTTTTSTTEKTLLVFYM